MLMPALALEGKKVLVTGAAGFIGAAFCSVLLQKHKGIRVTGLDSLTDYYDVTLKEDRLRMLDSLSVAEGAEWDFVKGSIADNDLLRQLFEKNEFDIVVNLAAQAGVRYSIENPQAYIDSNIIGFFNILECCRHSYDGGRRGVEHLVYASSSSVYGANSKVPYSTEDKTDSPVSLYAATKKSNELFAHAYSKLYSIPATGLRFFTVYGPQGRPDMAYYSFTEKLRKGEIITLFNYGNCYRDFTYVDDIVEGICRVTHCPPERGAGDDGLPLAPHRVYNIGGSNPVKLTDFANILCDELKAAGVLPESFDLAEHLTLAPMQPGDVEITCADSSGLENDFGFRPQVSLKEGLGEFARWYAKKTGVDR